MGKDGTGAYTARDAYAFALGYFNNDYKPVNDALTAFNSPEALYSSLNQVNLYNGNIAHTVVDLKALGGDPMARTYQYDQLNRLLKANTATNGVPNIDNWSFTSDYYEQLSYDPNGNIITNKRNGQAGNNDMDQMEYRYTPGTNKLDHVRDAVSNTNYAVDIDDQDTTNYRYDAIGNLVRDSAEGLDTILWNLYGKIQEIDKHNGDTIKFAYDATGNRIMKEVYSDSLTKRTYTYYVRDATGNIMATYDAKQTVGDTSLVYKEDEVVIYGSSRLGTISPALQLYPAVVPDSSDMQLVGVNYFTTNLKQYELTNHLGNVLSTISDRRLPQYVSGTFNHYEPEVVTAQDYYAFGMIMPAREFSIGGYRFGFNGMEKDDKIKGDGNSLDFGDRIYDSRLGKWLSLDPQWKKNDFESNYSYTSGNPILYIDIKGAKKYLYIYVILSDGTKIQMTKAIKISNEVKWHADAGHDGNVYVYNTDIRKEITYDLRGAKSMSDIKVTVTETSDYSSKETLSEYISSGFDNHHEEDKKGEQNSGFVFTADWAHQLDGAKTEAKEGGTKNLDVTFILAATTIAGNSPEAFGSLQPHSLEYAENLHRAGEIGEIAEEELDKGKENEKPLNNSVWCDACQRNISKVDTPDHQGNNSKDGSKFEPAHENETREKNEPY